MLLLRFFLQSVNIENDRAREFKDSYNNRTTKYLCTGHLYKTSFHGH